MPDNDEIRYGRMFDDVRYNVDRTTTKIHVAEYYIGAHGPFTEKVDDSPMWHIELANRIEATRTTLRNLPR